MARTFTNGRDLVQHQQERLKRLQNNAQQAHRQAVDETMQEAVKYLHGTPRRDTLGRRRQTFQRRTRSFSIGMRSGTLAQGLRVVYQRQSGGASAFITDSAKYAGFVLSPRGTSRMRGVPFFPKLNEFYIKRSHQLAVQAQQQANRS